MLERPKTLVVTIPGMITPADLEPVREISEVDYHEFDSITQDALAALCEDYDYLMLNFDVIRNIEPSFYLKPAVKNLKAISLDLTGYDWVSPEAAKKSDIVLMDIPGYSTESVAETILCDVLLHARNRHSAYQDQIKGRPVEERKGINLRGETAGIVGLGNIGKRSAELFQAIGMNVLTWQHQTVDPTFDSCELKELFERSKVICITAKTVSLGANSNLRFINEEVLDRCNGSIIVNLSHKDLVDHEAMARQIKAGKIIGYTIERRSGVLEMPIANLEQVHLPPYDAWFSDESMNNLRTVWVSNTVSAINGNPNNQV